MNLYFQIISPLAPNLKPASRDFLKNSYQNFAHDAVKEPFFNKACEQNFFGFRLGLMAIEIVKKHPLFVRWNHWINFPVLTVMVWSGFLIYWANPEYLLPGEWLTALGMDAKLAMGLSWHFVFGILFLVNGICYVAFLIYSQQWRYLFPDRDSLKDAFQVLLHDLHLVKGPLPAQVKYNGAQRLTYTAVIFLALFAVLTGFAIYKPVQLAWLASAFGGYTVARIIHFVIALSFILFFIVHIVQVIRAGWNHFQAMVTGWQKSEEKK